MLLMQWPSLDQMRLALRQRPPATGAASASGWMFFDGTGDSVEVIKDVLLTSLQRGALEGLSDYTFQGGLCLQPLRACGFSIALPLVPAGFRCSGQLPAFQRCGGAGCCC